MNGEKVIGVVGIAIDTRKLSPEERAVLGAWVSLLAIALVRAGLSSEAKQAAMLREADKLRTALFNSVSHELRTPLAAIMASVYTLNDKRLLMVRNSGSSFWKPLPMPLKGWNGSSATF